MPHFFQRPISSRIWLTGCAALVTATWVWAQSDNARTPQKQDESPRRAAAEAAQNVIMTPERQAAALKFAELHHPELYQLLQRLKRGSREEYQQAVRQLYNDSERLARLKERIPARYEFLLTEWQLDSRLRLLVARMTMSAGDPVLEAELEDLLKKRLDNRLALLKWDRERQAARLARLDDQIDEIESDREAAIHKDLLRIKRSLGIGKRNPKKAGPAETKTSPERN